MSEEAAREQQSLREERRVLLRAQRRDAGGGEQRDCDQAKRQHAERGEGAARLEGRGEGLLRACFEARLLARLGAVGLDHADPGERLLDLRGERAVARPRAPETNSQAPGEQRR